MSTPSAPSRLDVESTSVKQLHQHLISSLRPRVLDIPAPPSATAEDARVAVLFSGGLDCTVLARLASDLVPVDQPIDLLNVAFENPRIAAQNSKLSQDELYELCPDRITGRKAFGELVTVCPRRRWRLVAVSFPLMSSVNASPTTIYRSTFPTKRHARTDQTSFSLSTPTTRKWTSP